MPSENPDYRAVNPNIAECNKFLDRAHQLWIFYSDSMYRHQDSINKTYLWLTITLLTAQAAMFTSFFIPAFYWSFLSFNLSVLCSVSCLILGLLLMTDFFLPSISQNPGMNIPDALKYINEWGSESCAYYMLLESLGDQYEASKNALIDYLNKKTKFLRMQCFALIISFALLLLSLTLFNLQL